ncbi:MAG: DUF1800 family protein [Bryobacterales bacterium]|nr:DUF1800 family protein [Acidobacteriota bacterium]MCB9384171.1 DUF1800 family protein [Bryobacterales bacterium]
MGRSQTAADAPIRSRQRATVNAIGPTQAAPFWGGRVRSGLAAYYPLVDDGTRDQAGALPGLDLELSGEAARLSGRNGLAFPAKGAARTTTASALRDAIVSSGAFTLEAWVQPAALTDGEMQRFLTFSEHPWNANFTLAAEGDVLQVRVRTSETDGNAWPPIEVPGGFVAAKAHYVVTFAEGVVRVYRDAELLTAETHEGDLSNWDSSFALTLGNEAGNDRPFLGEMYEAAIYSRALEPLEIRRNFLAGDDAAQGGGEQNRAPDVEAGADQTIIAPADTVALRGAVADEGVPQAPATEWTMLSGPGQAQFSSASSPHTQVRFTAPGDYELALSANDGELTASDVVHVRVAANDRVGQGLVAFYPFSEGAGAQARNQIGGAGPDLDLLEGAEWLSGKNGVRLGDGGRLQSPAEAAALRDALVATNAFTIELWVRPDTLVTDGPLRMFTLSESYWGERNFTLAQDREGLQVRLRTSDTRDDAWPFLRASRAFYGNSVQVAATFDGERLKLLVNGEVAMDELYPGDLSNWASEMPLVLGGERRGEGAWSGEMYLAAVYNRPLSAPELHRNYLATESLLDGGAPVANDAPAVQAGDDRLLAMRRDTLALRGSAVDDGLPGAISLQWSKLEGPGEATFSDAAQAQPSVRFSAPGVYTLELSASDGQFTMRDAVEVVVAPEWAPRLLDQSSWGPTRDELQRVVRIGPDEYLTEQFTAQPSDFPDDEIGGLREEQDRFYAHALNNRDQLRQRMVFALSKIFVVSANAVGRRDQMVPYLRLLNEHAFGNVLDLLHDVTLSPTMGRYLDMVDNAAYSEDNPEPPNENYGRELLQLFTIGTELLNPDGTPQLGADGEPLAAYGEEQVRQFSRALTGWTYPTYPQNELQWPNYENYSGPMEPYEERHDHAEKFLLNGVTLPAGQSARQDLDGALRNLFEHPNMGPFLGKQLIQQLVTSDPSPAYVARVSAAFADNGAGERGDLQAVLRAILLDPEAQTGSATGGHLREPILYQTALLRGVGALATPNNGLADNGRDLGQWVFYPPSVFSYFSPSYRIPGSGVLAPEFQLHTKASALARADFAYLAVLDRVGYGVSIELSELMPLGDDLDRLCDRIDAELFLGRMTNEVRAAVRRAAAAGETPQQRVRNAVFVAASSAEFQVQH